MFKIHLSDQNTNEIIKIPKDYQNTNSLGIMIIDILTIGILIVTCLVDLVGATNLVDISGWIYLDGYGHA